MGKPGGGGGGTGGGTIWPLIVYVKINAITSVIYFVFFILYPPRLKF